MKNLNITALKHLWSRIVSSRILPVETEENHKNVNQCGYTVDKS
jgi:hypothetical protein